MQFKNFFFIVITLFSVSLFAEKKIRIMGFNVENLWDIVENLQRNDTQYIPDDVRKINNHRTTGKTVNWTAEKLELKLSQIKKIITAENKEMPDILTAVEIESEDVANQLAKKLGYSHFMITQGPDKRGINTAIFYNESEHLKAVFRSNHLIQGEGFHDHPTRDILEVGFMVNGKYLLDVFVNHWPSQGGPVKVRSAAARVLRNAFETRYIENPEMYMVAMGDFNVIDKDKPNPIFDVLLKRSEEPVFLDLHTEFSRSSKVKDSMKKDFPKGTYYYVDPKTEKGEWNVLDRTIFSSNLLPERKRKGLAIDITSYRINAPSCAIALIQGEKAPLRYNFDAKTAKDAGFSDHFAIEYEITINE
jgi:endonuclease/exonuclease/phosphatase family metal-dependent hydrolase